MLVYRSASRIADVTEVLDDLASRLGALDLARSSEDELRTLLIDAGELEAAIVDAECPDADDLTPIGTALSALILRIADAFLRAARGEQPSAVLGELQPLLAAVREHAPRGQLTLSVAEGFAYYGLFPETYLSAARDFRERCTPQRVLVVGIRSIGTTLSAVVAATLARDGIAVERITVRPRAHPFDRELRLSPRLTRVLRDLATDDETTVAIVDEGPGISGSSFGCVSDFFSRLGLPDDRIVLFPSWNPAAASLRNRRAASRWERHAKFIGSFDRDWLESGRLERHFGVAIVADLSAGAWRNRVYADGETPAVQPQHERRKFLATRADGEQMLIKFEGLGSHGDAHRDRAGRLAAAGFGPEVIDFRDGFLATRWIEGRPLDVHDVGCDLLRRIAGYVAWMRCEERVGSPADPAPLAALLETNTREGLGEDWIEAVRQRVMLTPRIAGEPAVRVDGRMMPHEWLRTSDGFVKTDGASHFDDHFYPGAHDAAWDLAGASVELGLDASTECALVAEYVAASGDRNVAERLRFFRPAYLAFRLGYATLAAEALGSTPDALKMRGLADRYSSGLRRELTVSR